MAQSTPPSMLLPPGVSIEVSAGLRRVGRIVWGHLRFDRDGLRFRPQGAGGYVRLALSEIERLRWAPGGVLEVDGRGRTYAWTGDGVRRIHGELQLAIGVAAA